MSVASGELNTLLASSSEQRRSLFFELVKQNQFIYILSDQHGAVILVAEDEDCVPVWPSEEAALLWKNQEWSDCEAKAISVKDWLSRWTKGLQQDGLSLLICPMPGEDAEVTYVEEFEQRLLN